MNTDSHERARSEEARAARSAELQPCALGGAGGVHGRSTPRRAVRNIEQAGGLKQVGAPMRTTEYDDRVHGRSPRRAVRLIFCLSPDFSRQSVGAPFAKINSGDESNLSFLQYFLENILATFERN